MTKITTTVTPRPIEDAMHRAVAPEEITEADDLARLAESIAAQWPTPDIYLPKIKQQITDILVTRGYPAPGAAVFHRGQAWRTFAQGEQPEPGEKIDPGWNYARLCSEPLTPEREAAEIYRNIIEVEYALESGDVAQVFAHTVRLGVAVERFNLRRLHLKMVTRGKANRAATVAGGEALKAAFAHEKDARLGSMERLIREGHSIANAARITARNVGGTEIANKQMMKPSRRK